MNRIVMATAAAGLLLSACGGDDTPGDGTGSTIFDLAEATENMPPCPLPGEPVEEAIRNGCRTAAGMSLVVALDYGDCEVLVWDGGWGRFGEFAQAGDPSMGDEGPCPATGTTAVAPTLTQQT